MKVFVADDIEQGFVNSKDYHWCDNGELLMFGQFQIGNGNPKEVSMCGTKTRKFTTHIIVKDLKIDRDFYKDVITNSVEKAMQCNIDKLGDYSVIVGFEMKFNINDIVDELIEKASEFEDGQKLSCFGRTLSII